MAHALPYAEQWFDPVRPGAAESGEDVLLNSDTGSGFYTDGKNDDINAPYKGVQWIADFNGPSTDPVPTGSGKLEVWLNDDNALHSQEDIIARWGFSNTQDGVTPSFFDNVLPGEENTVVLVAYLDEGPGGKNWIGDDGRTQFQIELIADKETGGGDLYFDKARVSINSVPEPGTMLLLGFGLLGLAGINRRKLFKNNRQAI